MNLESIFPSVAAILKADPKPETVAKFNVQDTVSYLKRSIFRTNCSECRQYLGGPPVECGECDGLGYVDITDKNKTEIVSVTVLYSTKEDDGFVYSILPKNDEWPSKVVAEENLFKNYAEAQKAI